METRTPNLRLRGIVELLPNLSFQSPNIKSKDLTPNDPITPNDPKRGLSSDWLRTGGGYFQS
jgi:hypothetical protein